MADVPTVAWSETTPAGGDNIALGDNRIREMKTQIREVIDVDHDFPSSGKAADVGQHKRVTLQEQADLGTGATGVPILGAQTADGKAELVFTDEDDNDIQLTKAGEAIPPSSPTLANWAGVLALVYPVGSIYVNASDATNPATLLGFGTWDAFGAGRVMVGFNDSDSDFDTAEETGGEKTHTLTTAEMPSHSHAGIQTAVQSGGDQGGPGSWYADRNQSGSTQSTGSGSAHNNLQPYIVVYMWKTTG
jgi:hypothetical protein